MQSSLIMASFILILNFLCGFWLALNYELMFISELVNAILLSNYWFSVLLWIFFLFFPASRSVIIEFENSLPFCQFLTYIACCPYFACNYNNMLYLFLAPHAYHFQLSWKYVECVLFFCKWYPLQLLPLFFFFEFQKAKWCPEARMPCNITLLHDYDNKSYDV